MEALRPNRCYIQRRGSGAVRRRGHFRGPDMGLEVSAIDCYLASVCRLPPPVDCTTILLHLYDGARPCPSVTHFVTT